MPVTNFKGILTPWLRMARSMTEEKLRAICHGPENNPIRLNGSRPLMIAHRGSSGIFEQNTRQSFEKAAQFGYYGIETDVHKTIDGAFVLCHDERMIDRNGNAFVIEQTDLQTIRNIKFRGKTGREYCLPSLHEYIQICKNYNCRAIVEIKNQFSPQDLLEMMRQIDQFLYLPFVTFISFNRLNLIQLRKLLPEQHLQLVAKRYSQDTLDFLQKYRLDLDLKHTALNREIVDEAHRHGITVNTWTVNTVRDAQRVIKCGVDMITSNILL